MARDQGASSVTECSDWNDQILERPRAVTSSPRGPEACPGRLESAARASCASHVFTDSEWARARVRLLEYAAILHAWDRKVTTGESGRGDGDVILPGEPPP
jgi:hypothetical protein